MTALPPTAENPNPQLFGPDAHRLLDKRDPTRTARAFLKETFDHPDHPTLIRAMEAFYLWNGRSYEEIGAEDLTSRLYEWLEGQWQDAGPKSQVLPFQPTRHDAADILASLRAIAFTPARPACWLRREPGEDRPDAALSLCARNGIMDLGNPASPLLVNTPLLFTTHSIDLVIDAAAPPPAEWLRFLEGLWPGDDDSKGLLQEWFGYCLTRETRAEKMLLLVGPPRSGKGTIAKVLTGLLGDDNVCAPTLSGLATNFGLAALIGKPLGIIPDARLSGRSDIAIVVERLLSLSAADRLTIDRKQIAQLTVKFPTRLMLCTNELPRLSDASGALASRFLVLTLSHGHLGREDLTLADRLLVELPGILMWALAGWQRLYGRGCRFLQPAAGRAALADLAELGSPAKKFVQQWCVLDPAKEIECGELYSAWRAWCHNEGQRPTANGVFGRDLRAVIPELQTIQRRIGASGSRQRFFKGVCLSHEGLQEMMENKGVEFAEIERDTDRNS